MPLIDLTLTPRDKDLGSFSVRRLLPSVKRKTVGPFIFLDNMGPAHFKAGDGIDVRAHPHIGLATVTYLFKGEIMHRDSVGSKQTITPGAINWMTAGRGITHSERTNFEERSHIHDAHGLQSWVALPKENEEMAPEFFHHPAGTLPTVDIKGVKVKILAGKAFGFEAPVKIYSPLFYIEVVMKTGQQLKLPNDYKERALYVIDGTLRIGSTLIEPKTMPIFRSDQTIALDALTDVHVMLLGGDPLAEQRFIDWNFVSSSKERIEQAKDDWLKERFPKIPGDDQEFIPLPEQRHARA